MTIDATTFAPGVESGGPTAPNGPGLVVTNGTLADRVGANAGDAARSS